MTVLLIDLFCLVGLGVVVVIVVLLFFGFWGVFF